MVTDPSDHLCKKPANGSYDFGKEKHGGVPAPRRGAFAEIMAICCLDPSFPLVFLSSNLLALEKEREDRMHMRMSVVDTATRPCFPGKLTDLFQTLKSDHCPCDVYGQLWNIRIQQNKHYVMVLYFHILIREGFYISFLDSLWRNFYW